MSRWLVLLALVVAGCGSVASQRLPTLTPSATCDFRMVDHNRRACAERGGTFEDPAPGSPSCGRCVTTMSFDRAPFLLCTSTGWTVTCVEEMPAR